MSQLIGQARMRATGRKNRARGTNGAQADSNISVHSPYIHSVLIDAQSAMLLVERSAIEMTE